MESITDLDQIEGLFDWPFKNMTVGSVVEFDKSIASKAQTYAHQYGHRFGKKFKTKRRKSDGALFVKRVE